MGAILWASDAPFVPPAPEIAIPAIPAFADPGQALSGPSTAAPEPAETSAAPEPTPRIVVHYDQALPLRSRLRSRPAETFAERKTARTASERRRRAETERGA